MHRLIFHNNNFSYSIFIHHRKLMIHLFLVLSSLYIIIPFTTIFFLSMTRDLYPNSIEHITTGTEICFRYLCKIKLFCQPQHTVVRVFQIINFQLIILKKQVIK